MNAFDVTLFFIKSKAKNAMDVVNFMNNVESVFDHLVKRNDCYRVDSLTNYMVEAGASTRVGFNKCSDERGMGV